jgi:hypothetical protein
MPPAPIQWAPYAATTGGDPAALSGVAYPNTPRACPVGLGNPLNLLKGITFQTALAATPSTPALFSGTLLTFSFLNPNAYSGDISVSGPGLPAYWPGPPTAPAGPTTGINPAFAPVAYTGGRYIIYADCSGGELLLMGGITSGVANGTVKTNAYTQLEFLFTDLTFSRIVSLADGGQTP